MRFLVICALFIAVSLAAEEASILNSILDKLKSKDKVAKNLQQSIVSNKEVTKQTTESPGILDTLKAKLAGVKQKVTGKTAFKSKDKLFDSLLNTFGGFKVMEERVSLVRSYGSELSKFDGKGAADKPKLDTNMQDYAAIRILAAARATNKKNLPIQLHHLMFDLKAISTQKKGRLARALWKYLALCALKMTPTDEWRTKPLKELIKPAEMYIKESGREDWFNVPITKSHVVFGVGKGKLPWTMEPRTAKDLLNGMIALMSTSGRFKTLTSKKAITLGWEKTLKLADAEYAAAVRDLLNLKYVNARNLNDDKLHNKRARLMRELMTLVAVNLENIIAEGEEVNNKLKQKFNKFIRIPS